MKNLFTYRQSPGAKLLWLNSCVIRRWWELKTCHGRNLSNKTLLLKGSYFVLQVLLKSVQTHKISVDSDTRYVFLPFGIERELIHGSHRRDSSISVVGKLQAILAVTQEPCQWVLDVLAPFFFYCRYYKRKYYCYGRISDAIGLSHILSWNRFRNGWM